MEVTRYVETGGVEGIGKAIIEMPPRHGKTVTTSRLYPPWHIGRNPDHRLMLVSYGATLAEKNSRAARNLIASPKYQQLFPIGLAKDSRAVNTWSLAESEGGADAIGIAGAATGSGAHILLIDDPTKNREEAENKLMRDKNWDRYLDDLSSRLEPSGAEVVMATRWHEDDLIGRLLKYQPGKWFRLRLPAIAEENDPLGRAVGEALWPERYPIEVLREKQENMGDYSWSALYQQNPVPAEGGIFKRAWFETLLRNPPPCDVRVRGWDLAMSEKTSADYSASVLMGVSEDGMSHTLDVTRDRIDWGDLVEYMARIILEDGPNVIQGVERKGYMSRAIQALNADPRLRGYSIFGFDVDTDKVTRALPFAARCGANRHRVADRGWTQDYVDELCSFTGGAHDDLVDASSIAERMLDGPLTSYAGGVTYADDQYTGAGPY